MTPVELLVSRLKDARPTGNGYTAKCPAHEDRVASLSIGRGSDGRALVKCFAGCTAESVALAAGLEVRDLFPRGDLPSIDRKRPLRKIPPITIIDLARDKDLPADFLRSLGLKDLSDGVLIPYLDMQGADNPRKRLRKALSAKAGSLWLPGEGDVLPYGLDRLVDAQEVGFLVLVEGESDCWTLWHHGFPALGIPGAAMTGTIRAEHLLGINTLYYLREPDAGGDRFSEGIPARFAEIGYAGRLREVKPPEGIKDANDWHKADPAKFPDAFRGALEEAPVVAIEGKSHTLPTEAVSGESFRLTDLGNAKRLAARHGRILRYVFPWKKWLVYDGTRWTKDETGLVQRLAKETVASLYAEAAQAGDPEERKGIAAHATRSESQGRLEAMAALAQSEEGIPLSPASLDADPYRFNVRNGTLDLLSGRLLPHDPEDCVGKLSPVTFDPEADAPTWEAFLSRITGGNAALTAFLQRFAGYAMTGNTSEQCLLLGYGTGANGKSTLIETLTAILGEYAATADFQTFAPRGGDAVRNDLARLQGARLVTAIEAADGCRFDEATIKRLTGGDTVTARFLYGEFFEFKPQFKLFLAANHKPRIRGTDHAIWRRIRLVPFSVTIPPEEQDRELPRKLLAESPGILNWMLEGCLAWRREGLGIPEEVRSATAEYREEEDPLSDFLADCCVTGPAMSASARELYQAYVRWAESNGENPIRQKTFGTRLSERGFDQYRGTGGRRSWIGIGVRSDASDA